MNPPIGKRWHTREDSGIRLDAQLRWWHDDELVEHPRIIEAFNQGLVVAEDGRFQLRFGNDWCIVTVEDSAYEVRSVEAAGDRLLLQLSDRTSEPLDPTTVLESAEGGLTCRVKAGRAKARFSRSAQVELGSFLTERDGRWMLRVGELESELPGLSH